MTNSPPALTHHVFHVAGVQSKRQMVRFLASGASRRILVMHTAQSAGRLADHLTATGIPSVGLHDNLSAPTRDRNLATFAAGAARVLVATDSGVDVEVDLVVHVDPPTGHQAYQRRADYADRARSARDVVTVVLPEQRHDVSALMRKAGVHTRPQSVTAHSKSVTTLVGDCAAHQLPARTAASGGRAHNRHPVIAASADLRC